MGVTGHSLAGTVVSLAEAMLLVAGTEGCSFAFTRGPQPSLPAGPGPETSRPPTPECTSSVAAPVVDTVLSTLSVAVFVTGIAALATPEPSCSQGSFGVCFRNFNQSVGWTGIIAGGLTSTLFIASAVTGYGRTADCRAAIEASARPPPPRASVPPSFVPLEGCGPVGDVPRVCSSVASWWTGGEAPGRDARGARGESPGAPGTAELPLPIAVVK